MPGITRTDLEVEAAERYSPGTGPWSKQQDLDQVDLVHLETMARSFEFRSDERGLMAGCIERLCQEVRRARCWPEPPLLEDAVLPDAGNSPG